MLLLGGLGFVNFREPEKLSWTNLRAITRAIAAKHQNRNKKGESLGWPRGLISGVEGVLDPNDNDNLEN